jgi:hypothetical protein
VAIDLVVGCPVRRREWIIDDWFDHVERSAVELGWRPTYAIVGNRGDPTVAIVAGRCAIADRQLIFAHVDDDLDRPDKRAWNVARFGQMVKLRNTLLSLVRAEKPRYFLSLDSDILLGTQTLAGLVQATGGYGAVGGATFMTPTSEMIPSCGWLKGMNGLIRRRIETKGVIPVDVIMAIKLMTPAAYAVDYTTHPQGEDIGWSRAASQAGVKLGWDNRWPSKHCMSPADLHKVDVRLGW